MVTILELADRFFEVDIYVDGKSVSLNEKRALWFECSLAEDRHIFLSETIPPLQYAVFFLKGLAEGRRVFVQPSGIAVDIKAYQHEEPFDIALFTSGSSGAPKFRIFDLGQIIWNSERHIEGYLEWSELKGVLQTLPLNHSYGLSGILLAALLSRKALYLFNKAPLFSQIPSGVLASSFLPVTPSQIRFQPRKENPFAPKVLSIGSAALTSSDLDKLKSNYAAEKTYVSYGLTEAGPRVTAAELSLPGQHHQMGGNYIGRPLQDVQVRILDSDRNLHREGVGSLAVKSRSLAKNLTPESFVDGFYITGDLVYVEGTDIYFIDRDENLIKKSGLSLGTFYIEQKIRAIQGIDDCAVIKKKSAVYDEVPIVFYSGTLAEEELWASVKEVLPLDWWPQTIIRMECLPRHGLNKVSRKELERILSNS